MRGRGGGRRSQLCLHRPGPTAQVSSPTGESFVTTSVAAPPLRPQQIMVGGTARFHQLVHDSVRWQGWKRSGGEEPQIISVQELRPLGVVAGPPPTVKRINEQRTADSYLDSGAYAQWHSEAAQNEGGLSNSMTPCPHNRMSAQNRVQNPRSVDLCTAQICTRPCFIPK